MRHLCTLAAAAALALAAGPLLCGSNLSGTALAMGGKPTDPAARHAQTGELGSVAQTPVIADMGVGQRRAGDGNAPSGNGVFGGAFCRLVDGLLSGLPAWMQALGDASVSSGTMSDAIPSPDAAALAGNALQSSRTARDVPGIWSAPNGIAPLRIEFQSGGACTLFDKGHQVDGTWETSGDMISLRFVNGRSFALTYSVEGDYLVLSDGSCLQRQQDAGPQAPKASADPKDLLGTWRAWDGRYAVTLTFEKKSCTLNANAKQYKGDWKARGSWLHVDFDGASPLDLSFAVEGRILRLSDGTILLRQ